MARFIIKTLSSFLCQKKTDLGSAEEREADFAADSIGGDGKGGNGRERGDQLFSDRLFIMPGNITCIIRSKHSHYCLI